MTGSGSIDAPRETRPPGGGVVTAPGPVPSERALPSGAPAGAAGGVGNARRAGS